MAIDGPLVVVVGEPTEFRALGTGGAPIEVHWWIDREDAAMLEAAGRTKDVVGKAVQLTALKKTTFELHAGKANGYSDGKVNLAAIEAPVEKPSLPFVGAGYGTLIIAVVILTIAGVLGLVGILSGEAVATLFGAIAGYIFVKAQQQGGDQSQPPASGD